MLGHTMGAGKVDGENQIGICRVCMASKPDQVCIFNELNLSSKLIELADIQVVEGDGLPSAICTDCEADLQRCYEFRVQVRWADQKLRESSVSQIDVEECNIKLERDHGVCEKINERNDSDIEDYSAENESHCDLDETMNDTEDNIYPQVSHVEVAENKREDISMINDPLGLDEPLIEAAHMKSDVGSADDPLKFVKIETTEPMETDNFGASTSASTSSAVLQDSKALQVDGVTRFNDMCSNRKFLPTIEGDKKASVLQKGNGSANINLQNKSKSSQFCQEPGSVSETLTNKYHTKVANNLNSKTESTKFSDTLSYIGERKTTTDVGLSCEYSGGGFTVDHDYISYNHTEYKSVCISEYKCDICNFRFSTINALDVHQSTTHIVSVEVECSLCHSIFKNKKQLADHLLCCENRFESSESYYVCPGCGLLFKTIKGLNNHGKRTHLEIERTIECDVCGKSFKFQNDLTYHKRFTHPEDKDKVSCEICSKEFLCQIRLNKHVRYTHCSIRKYTCSICQKTFKEKKTLDVHFTIHSTEKAYKCDVCQSAFRTKYKLKVHMTGHTKDQLNCKYCRKVFMVKENYENHLLNCKKKENQKFSCDICDKVIYSQTQFDLHMKFHVNPKMDLFTCDLCGKCFESKAKCEKHRFYHDVDNKSLQCSICSKTFKKNKILKNHMFLHISDTFLYKCEICGKPFKHSGAFHSHQRVHKNEASYECVRCCEKFKWKQTYDKHMSKCLGTDPNNPSTSDPSISIEDSNGEETPITLT